MSKIKDAMMRANDVKQHYHWNFMEHLYEMMTEQQILTSEDLDDMERELNRFLTQSSIIVPNEVLNNQYYEPKEENYYAN